MNTSAPAPAPPTAPGPAARVRRPRVSLWLLRALVTAHVLAVLAEPVLAGLFLTGDVGAIAVHATNASVLGILSLVMIATTVAYTVAGRGRLWVLPVAVLLFLAEAFQIAMGYARVLQVHIPLGVAIVTASVLLVIWVWSPGAGRAR